MRRPFAIAGAAAALLSACASLESKPMVGAETFSHGVVISRAEGKAATGETRAARAAWAALGLNPIAIAVAVAGVEDNFGTTNVFNYEIELRPSGERVMIQSQYPTTVGQCLTIRTNQQTGRIVMFDDSPARCQRP